jgi:dihydrolipoamide dehydrogenase
MSIQADVVVLGSGPGGYSAAFRAADLGKKVVIIERYETIGGVCLNVGCIPSKALLHAAKVMDEARHMSEFGIEFGAPKVDIKKLGKWKDSVVERLTGGLKMLAKAQATACLSQTKRLKSRLKMAKKRRSNLPMQLLRQALAP